MDERTFLFRLPEPDALAEAAAGLHAPVRLVGWKNAERNLDFPAVWLAAAMARMAGKDRYRRHRRFLALGGVEGLAVKAGLRIVERRPIWGGAAFVLVCAP